MLMSDSNDPNIQIGFKQKFKSFSYHDSKFRLNIETFQTTNLLPNNKYAVFQ